MQRLASPDGGADALSGLRTQRHQAKHYIVLASQAPYPAYRQALTGCILRFPIPILTFILSAKIVHHFPLTVNDSVTYSIAFFYICLNLFLRYLWLNPAFSAVRFNVHGINRSDMQHVLRKF
ncbi:hypothetical protein [Citrobacter sp. Igbk 16]|uniref:hypothetical protein n=1 Tax=Citrobacter sp. Igbk 16 TaxID=2963958 RepID=UPI002302725C|nr:hypothetical protein [Citrobacter sp. Igbk 16]MDA8515320.1 hypothetical protein [Citrobacter sp. Igbk 16]